MSEDDPEEPLGGLADEVARRRDDEDEPDVFDEAFEDVDVAVDSEAVWERLAGDDTEGAAAEAASGSGERVVDKRSFCHRCKFFSEPPDISCAHEGTEIIELADVERFRVRDCPVVAERDRLEGMD